MGNISALDTPGRSQLANTTGWNAWPEYCRLYPPSPSTNGALSMKDIPPLAPMISKGLPGGGLENGSKEMWGGRVWNEAIGGASVSK